MIEKYELEITTLKWMNEQLFQKAEASDKLQSVLGYKEKDLW